MCVTCARARPPPPSPAVVSGNLWAIWFRVPKMAVRNGVYGFNAVLLGMATSTFFVTNNPSQVTS